MVTSNKLTEEEDKLAMSLMVEHGRRLTASPPVVAGFTPSLQYAAELSALIFVLPSTHKDNKSLSCGHAAVYHARELKATYPTLFAGVSLEEMASDYYARM